MFLGYRCTWLVPFPSVGSTVNDGDAGDFQNRREGTSGFEDWRARARRGDMGATQGGTK